MLPNIAPLLSIVIPVKNGEAWLETCLHKIMKQTLISQAEIIVLDSGSTDRSLEIIQQFDIKLHTVNPDEFNHGLTRNYGASVSNGKYVVMTVQDAIPADNEWLQKLLDGFDNENVAGVCGQQVVPHDKDKNPVDWFRPINPPGKKKYHFNTAEEFDRLSPDEKVSICRWDDVTACYRRDILLKVPFQDVSFAEDAVWAKDALRAGYSIVYNTAARVYHYHHEEVDFAFRRTLAVLYFKYKFFGHIPASVKLSFKRKLQIIKLLLKEKISFSDKIKWWKHNLAFYKAAQKAFVVFTEALKNGKPTLDKVYLKYCKIAPMAKGKEFS